MQQLKDGGERNKYSLRDLMDWESVIYVQCFSAEPSRIAEPVSIFSLLPDISAMNEKKVV